jgi:cysteinyl-tRNA synthetase
MDIYLHNSLSRKKEQFIPADPARVTMYVCGPTVYNFVHIGNARPVIIFDVLFRLLSQHFPKVIYARNITDVDDKINAAALALNQPIRSLAEFFAQAFHDDIAQLNAKPPSIEPWATDHIAQMITLIKRLIERGYAYEASGHVLFHVPSKPDYGKLSGRRRDDMIAGARVEVAPFKKDAADFVLWKPSTPHQPGWESPWGIGRPGWHIECTAMINTHLGQSIDIHGGGQDLIFPHHENEIAQGEGAYDGQYVRYWLHNGYITVNGQKMSKSLGNFHTVRDLLRQFPGEAIRYALLSGHYRQPLDFSLAALAKAKTALDRLYANLPADWHELTIRPDNTRAIHTVLADDLNTPRALAFLHETAGKLRQCQDTFQYSQLLSELREAADLLGLLQQSTEQWQAQNMPTVSHPDYDKISRLIADRQKARNVLDYAQADALRDELLAMGICVKDSGDETFWHPIHSKVNPC